MHRIFLVAKRDYLATIRSKPFLFGLIVAPILFGGGFIGIALMKSSRSPFSISVRIIIPVA